MGPLAGRLEPWLVALAATSLIAWSLLAIDGSDGRVSSFCSASVFRPPPLTPSLELALLINSPGKLASSVVMMIVAMMPPLLIAPLRHVRERTFVRRRRRSTLLFLAGYALLWITAGMALQTLALAVRWTMPVALGGLAPAVLTAILWQVSPAKQWCLNRCHRRPQLAAFGMAADRAAFMFGLTHGASCAGACWALMLLPLLMTQGHVIGMGGVTLFVIAERVERPAVLAWRWRGFGKAMRITGAQLRLRASS